MNSQKITKHVNRKEVTHLTMGQKLTTATDSKTCSIFSVDEEVEFVVDNNDEPKFSSTLPVDKNIELSRKTYSKRNPVTYPMIPQTPDPRPFDITLFSGIKNITAETLKSFTNTPVKRKYGGKLQSCIPEKFLKINPSSQISFNKSEQSCSFVVNEISSDSDIELIEEVIVNPNALKIKCLPLNSKKPVHNVAKSSRGRFSNNNKNSETTKKKCDIKPVFHHASNPSFILNNGLNFITEDVKEADTAPYMLNSSNNFSDGSSPLNWKGMNGNAARRKQSMIKKEKATPKEKKAKLRLIPKVEQSKKVGKSRELKNLYRNLDEIAWTQESSFKKLLRNPDYIRHSERGTNRISGSNKALRKIKQIAIKKANTRTLRKSPTLQASLKKSKLAKANSNKRLVNGSSNKLKPEVSEIVYLDAGKPPKIVKTGETKLDAKVKLNSPDLKVKTKALTNFQKQIQQKNDKKQAINGKNNKKKESPESPKIKNEIKGKIAIISKEKPSAASKPKVEISEASGSCMQNGFYNSVSNSISFNKNFNVKKFDPKNSHEMFNEFKENNIFDFKNCQFMPYMNKEIFNTGFTSMEKQLFQSTIRKAMEKQDPSQISEVLRGLVDSYILDKSLGDKVKRKKIDEESLRTSSRQSEMINFRCKGIVVRKHENFWNICLCPNTKKNVLTIEAIKELRDVFLVAKKTDKCRAVLISSSGSYFCSGIDFSQLIGNNKKQACEELASVIRELVLVLGAFSKPIIAAVNGDAFGFGVSLITYCDVVFASDKANFCIPSTTVGYMPEGGLTLTLPQVMGITRSSEMLMQGNIITAEEAHQKGLVSTVLWPYSFMHEVFPRVEAILKQPLPVMEATKLMLRSNVWEKLRTHMDFERQIIAHQWLTSSCQENMKKILSGDKDLIKNYC